MQATFDRDRMRQVITNLLGNAVEHAAPGSKVFLRATVEGDAARLEVTNRGPTIPQQHLQTIFEPLVQLEPDGASPLRSTNLGLGLFIVRQIVLAHGGAVTATSSDDAGTTFAVRLPNKREAVPA